MFHVGAKEKETWGELANCFAHNSHCLVLSNDNLHTYADVTRALKISMPDASDKIVQDLTELVDKEGRAILKVGSYKVMTWHLMSKYTVYYGLLVLGSNHLGLRGNKRQDIQELPPRCASPQDVHRTILWHRPPGFRRKVARVAGHNV